MTRTGPWIGNILVEVDWFVMWSYPPLAESACISQRAAGVRFTAARGSYQVLTQQHSTHLYCQSIPGSLRAWLWSHIFHQVLWLCICSHRSLHHSAACTGHQHCHQTDSGTTGPHSGALWVQPSPWHQCHERGSPAINLLANKVLSFPQTCLIFFCLGKLLPFAC